MEHKGNGWFTNCFLQKFPRIPLVAITCRFPYDHEHKLHSTIFIFFFYSNRKFHLFYCMFSWWLQTKLCTKINKKKIGEKKVRKKGTITSQRWFIDTKKSYLKKSYQKVLKVIDTIKKITENKIRSFSGASRGWRAIQ